MAAWYAVWIGLVALQRLHELSVSRRNIASVPPELRRPPADGPRGFVAMVIVHVALLACPLIEHYALDRRPPAALVVPCLVVFALAQGLRFWSIRSLGPRWNARGIVLPTLPVVDSGPYRYVRHPNYLAVLMEFVSLPLGGGAWISCLVLNLAHVPIIVRRIRGEERELVNVPGWAERMRTKPRLLPRLRA